LFHGRRDTGHPHERLAAAICAVLSVLVASGQAAAVAQEDVTVPAPPPPILSGVPVLLMLQTATTPTAAARENRFVEELGMVLDGVAVQVERPVDPQFAEHALGDQIARVRLLIDKHHAVAATWLTEAAPDMLLLHLVVVSTGRALVRLVETRPRPGFETDLALAARELLGTAFLFDRAPGPAGGDPIATVVESVRELAAPAPPPPAPVEQPHPTAPPPDSGWAVAAELRFEGGLVGAQGPRLYPGGALALDRRMFEGLHGRLSAMAYGGPLGTRRDEEEILEWAVQPGMALGYLFDLGATTLGPWIEVQALLSNVTTQIDGGDRQEFRSWRLRGAAVLDLRIKISGRVDLLLAAGLIATPQRDVYRREWSEKVLLSSAYLSGEGRMGFVVHLGSTRPRQGTR